MYSDIDVEGLKHEKYKKDPGINVIRLIHIFSKNYEKKPNKTNSKRISMLMDILEGMSSKEFVKKYGINSNCEPSIYINKIIRRFSTYAALDVILGIRDIKKYGNGLVK